MYPKIADTTSFDDAWQQTIASEEALAAYQTQAAAFGWPPFERSPFIAYWMARNVVGGKWAAAEPYIKLDPAAWIHYTTFVHIWFQLGGNVPSTVAKPVLPKLADDHLVDEVIARVEIFRNSRHRRQLSEDGGIPDEWET